MEEIMECECVSTSAFECFVVERKKIIKRKMERPHVCGVI
jgi:hypothetical protein